MSRLPLKCKHGRYQASRSTANNCQNADGARVRKPGGTHLCVHPHPKDREDQSPCSKSDGGGPDHNDSRWALEE